MAFNPKQPAYCCSPQRRLLLLGRNHDDSSRPLRLANADELADASACVERDPAHADSTRTVGGDAANWVVALPAATVTGSDPSDCVTPVGGRCPPETDGRV